MSTRNRSTRSTETATPSVTLSEGETVNPTTQILTPEAIAKHERESAISLLVSLYGLPSASSLTKALNAAKRVSDARATRGTVLSRLPIIREAVKGGKASFSKGEVTDRNGMTRDTSSLRADDVKALNAITTIVNAAETLGL